MLRYSVAVTLLLLGVGVSAQSASERGVVRLTATVQATAPSITLNWASISSTTSFTIQRKTKESSSWGTVLATPAASSLQWTDNSVSVGVNYEYRVVRISNGVTGTGYISTGIQVPVSAFRGKIILLVDNTLASQLVTEINQLISDLRGDGWSVLRSDVSRTASVTSVKTIVQAHYNSDPANVKAIYLLGHVPVPYSGDITPDGHDVDRGARPTDGYYGDVNGTWTDNTVNTTLSAHIQAHNVPGDGKFDQGDFPSPLELQVGRVDLYDLPAFSSSEVELMRSYLNKAHNFKVKGWEPTVRALLIDNLQWLGNPISGSTWRTAPLTGPVSPVPPAPVLGFNTYADGQSYLWTGHYGGGSQLLEGGVVTYNGIDGSSTTQDLAGSVVMGGAFNMELGSYFYDFDNRNNYLRAVIARGDGLTNVWAGIPAWYFHHMGMGDNIGYDVLQSMNNTGMYTPLTEGWQTSIGRTHMSLMGDPSLRMKMVNPPTDLSISNSGGFAAFAWTASSESVIGYHIYQFEASSGLITRLTTSPVTGSSYTNPAIPFVAGRDYMVRAVKLETNYSGSFYNQSLGAIATSAGTAAPDCLGVVGGTALVGTACNDNNACTSNDTWNASCQCVGTGNTTTATVTAAGATSFCTGGSVGLNANTGAGLTYIWKRNSTTVSGATASSYTATLAGTYTVTVTASGCSATSSGLAVTVSAAPAATITAAGTTSFCAGGGVVLNANTGTGLTYVWKRNSTTISGATSGSYTATLAGTYTVTVTANGCSTTSSGLAVTVSAAPAATITAAGSTSFCAGGSVALNANTGAGLTYAWKQNGTAISGANGSSHSATSAGTYTVTVSSVACSTTSSGLAVTVNAAPSATITAAGPTSFCAGGSVALNANTGAGLSYVWKRNGTTISGATTSSYTASLAGTYTVAVTSSGCTTTSSGVVVSNSAGNTVTFNLNLDRYGAETTWLIRGGSTTYASGGPYTNRTSNGVYPQTPVSICLANGCYELVVNDTYGDGLCCAYGAGGFTLMDGNSNTLVSGGSFTFISVNSFCLGSSVLVSAQVMLEGPFGTGPLMSDALRSGGYIPTAEPYVALGFQQAGGGGETVGAGVLSTTGTNAIVDWVRMELRGGSPGYGVVATRSALVQRDGDIVDVDGTSPVSFSAPAGNYHVVVYHRNHLGIMTASPVALSATSVTVNFKASGTATYGTNSRKASGSTYMMWAGDSNSDGMLIYTGQYNDRDPVLYKVGGVVPTNTTTGYWREDLNMNGTVSYTGNGNDRDFILQNIGGIVPTNTRTEQVP